MLQVKEIYADGHEHFDERHLSYALDLANRIGFSLVDAVPERGHMTFRISLHVPMDEPIFLATLAEGRDQD